jgi:(p)ppGpp synthase/HD superfamily hydrolase
MLTIDKLFDAILFASVAHAGIKRGGKGTPYLGHLLDVARRLYNAGVRDEEVLQAAILHDVVEDTAFTLNDIEARFGKRVRDMVDDLTLPPEMVEKSAKDFAAKVIHQSAKMRTMDIYTMCIKVADKTSNVHDLAEDPPNWGRKAMLAYAEDSLAVVNAATEPEGQYYKWMRTIGIYRGDKLDGTWAPSPELYLHRLIRGFDRAYAGTIQKYA